MLLFCDDLVNCNSITHLINHGGSLLAVSDSNYMIQNVITSIKCRKHNICLLPVE